MATLACALPLLRLVPTWLAGALLVLGAVAAWSGGRRAWPAPLRLLLTISAAGMVLAAYGFRLGRDTGTALLLTMITLKLMETRTLRDGRSLSGFALFATFAAFLQDQGPVTLLLAIPAALLALVSLQRLAEAEAGLAPPSLPRRLRSAGTLLLLALPVALAAFWLFPRIGTPLWGIPDNALGRTGIDDRMAPGEFQDLLTDDRPAFRVRFDGTEPKLEQMYWRGPVLWNFDGRAWTRWGGYADLPRTNFAPAAVPWRYEITLEPTDKRFLFALDLPLDVPQDGQLGADYSPFADRPVRSLLRYTLRSAPPASFEPQLPAVMRQAALRLPPGFNPQALALAAQWRAEGADDAALIQRALAMYRREFSYALDAPPLGRNSVDEFLFGTRVGFCEHFASSFTVLMRAGGIPARVVTGYAGGYRNQVGDYWLVRQADAHAWSEVWLIGRGWVRVDPTAAVDPSRVFERLGDLAGEGGGLSGFSPMLDMGDWLRRGWNDFMLGFDASRQQFVLQPLGVAQARAQDLAIAFAVVVAVLLGLTFAWQLRQRPEPAEPTLRAWRQFVRRVERAGVPKSFNEPPLSFGTRAARAFPAHAEKLLALSRGFAEWRYARASLDESQHATLIRGLRSFRIGRSRHPTSGVNP